MADPLTIGAAGLSLAGGITGALGARASGRAQSEAADFNTDIGVSNATSALRTADAGVQRLRYAGARLQGAQRAGYGAAGIDIGQGTPADVYGDTAGQLRLAELIKFYEGDVSAAESMNKAQLATATGKAAATASNYQAGASLLSGLGGAASGLTRVNWDKIF